MKILVTGHRGMLGSVLLAKLLQAGEAAEGVDLPDQDLTDVEQVKRLAKQNYQFIYNCAAFTNVDLCEQEKSQAYAANAQVVKNLVELFPAATILQISTDYVFSGQGVQPYRPEDKAAPLSVYGQTKLAGEEFLLKSANPKKFIVRTAWLYGHQGKKNFVETVIRLSTQQPELKVVDDQRGAPTFANDLADVLLKFLPCQNYGIYHFTNSGETTWYGFTQEIFRQLQIKTRVVPCTTAEFPRPAKRPAYSVLSLEKTAKEFRISIPTWQDGLARYLQDRKLPKG